MTSLIHFIHMILVFHLRAVFTQQGNEVCYEIKINPEQMSAVVRDFGEGLEKLVCDVTAFKHFEDKYMKYGGNEELDGTSLVNEIAGDINKMLKKKIDAVKALVKVAQEANHRSVYNEFIDIEYLNNKKLLSDDDLAAMNITVEEANKTYNYISLKEEKDFNNELVNFDTSTIHVPTNVFDKAPLIQNGVNWTEALDNQFKKNRAADTSLKWQYFCSSDGFFRIYPGMKWPKNNTDGRIDMFDCRIRSWYIKAATSPKNLLILVDKSGSMKGIRMKITHFTIDKILQTLSDEDHFNIIQFSDKPKYLDNDCANRTLIHASESNKRRMLEKVKEIKPEMTANFTKALIEAFELFQEEEEELNLSNQSEQTKGTGTGASRLCNKAIMLITDRTPESDKEVFEEFNWPNKSVRVFTFLVGRESSDANARSAKWMANANRGYFTHISALADVQENVQEYIKVMSRPLALSRSVSHVWTSLYADYVTEVSDEKDKGLQYITSFASPVYDTRVNHTVDGLLGVAGTDVTVKQIQEIIPYNRLGPNSYAFVVTHQGYVLFHPNFEPSYIKGNNDDEQRVYHPDFQNVDITEVEYAEDENLLNEMRKKLISGKKQEHISLITKMPYNEGQGVEEGKMRRVALRNYTFYFSKINETNFSLGIALAQTKVLTAAYNRPGKNIFKEDDYTEIAPWRYCKRGWTDRMDLYNIFDKKLGSNLNAEGCSDTSDSILPWELSWANDDVLKWWHKGILVHSTGSSHNNKVKQQEEYIKYGIEQVFFWSSAGMIKYLKATPNMTEPNFIKDNKETVKNNHFRQAVEGVELGYNFTYSVPFHNENSDPNNMVVTVTAPVYPRKAIVGVVGLQLKYSHFVKRMEDSINRRAVSRTDGNLSCKNHSLIHCYILDSNGYILYANTDQFYVEKNVSKTDVGKLLVDQSTESALMEELVNRSFFKKEQYLNTQVMCHKKNSINGENSATFLLNPFKQLFNLFLWILTETVIFLYEWSWFAGQQSVVVSECMTLQDVYKKERLEKWSKQDTHQFIWVIQNLDGYGICNNLEEPCTSLHTRYRINFTKLKKYKDHAFKETFLDPVLECNRSYTVQWISNTNLMFVSVTAHNFTRDNRHSPVDMDEKKEYTTEDKCGMLLKKSARTKTRKGCVDFHPGEPVSDSGTRQVSFSYALLMVTLFFCICNNQKQL